MILKKELGKKIQELRKSKRITQDVLAEQIGIDPKMLAKLKMETISHQQKLLLLLRKHWM